MTYYDSIKDSYAGLHGEEQHNKAEIIAREIMLEKTDCLLDVGCGTGIGSDLFDCIRTGIDTSKELLSQFNGTQILGRAEELPFDDKSFDLVLSVTAIHNFSDIKKALDEIRRVAKKKVVITILKRSEKKGEILRLIAERFNIAKSIIEEKDEILFLEVKNE